METKKLIQALGFKPKENTSNTYHKKYSECNNYEIEVDFDKKKINFGKIIKSESNSTQNFSQVENWVVIECVDRLLEKGYQPKDITLEKTWKTGHGTSGRLDILVTQKNLTFLMIECKTWGTEFDKEFKNLEKNGGQLFTYFQQDNNAEVLMLYASKLDEKGIIYKNEIVKIEEHYRQAGNVEDVYGRWNKVSNSNGVFENWVKPYFFENKKLTKKDLKPLNEEDSQKLFYQFLSILRKHSVS
ncbi:MAG: type I restriction enzyme HsdR N-terminal domain-containing protein, partial [Bacteroidota bacterium]|nr:type I restriction enzyme HsdR N-terminal domain-containing protein [Bacteroidota bacterium]